MTKWENNKHRIIHAIVTKLRSEGAIVIITRSELRRRVWSALRETML